MIIPSVFVLDVDGVMTDGGFYYSSNGKVMKKFGADDSDVLSMLDPYLTMHFISADHRGFDISHSRIVKDMNRNLDLVSATERLDWIKDRWDPKDVIYMCDGVLDYLVVNEVGYSIAPINADSYLKKIVDFVTKRKGGDRAVSEAGIHILEKFFCDANKMRSIRSGDLKVKEKI